MSSTFPDYPTLLKLNDLCRLVNRWDKAESEHEKLEAWLDLCEFTKAKSESELLNYLLEHTFSACNEANRHYRHAQLWRSRYLRLKNAIRIDVGLSRLAHGHIIKARRIKKKTRGRHA